MVILKKRTTKENAMRMYSGIEQKTANLKEKADYLGPFYHGTNPENLDSILRSRKLLIEKGREKSVCVADPVTARDYTIRDHADEVIIKADSKHVYKLMDKGKIRYPVNSPNMILSLEDLPAKKVFIIKRKSGNGRLIKTILEKEEEKLRKKGLTMKFGDHNPAAEMKKQDFYSIFANEDDYEHCRDLAGHVLNSSLKGKKSISFEEVAEKFKKELQRTTGKKGADMDEDTLHYILANRILDDHLESKVHTNKK